MSFVVPGINFCEKHWKRIDLINGCEDCEKEMKNMPPKAREYAKELEKKNMTNREWLLNKMQNMSDEELMDFNIRDLICGSNKCVKGTRCNDCKLNWLKSEHKEKIILSQAERIILENIDKEYKWICRDEDNYLRLFNEEPKKDIKDNVWVAKIIRKNSDILLDAFNHLFQFITWEDSEPYNIEELLKCGD